MTDVPRGITARRFIQALHEDGFFLKRARGSHRIYRHPDGRRVVIAYHRLSDTFWLSRGPDARVSLHAAPGAEVIGTASRGRCAIGSI